MAPTIGPLDDMIKDTANRFLPALVARFTYESPTSRRPIVRQGINVTASAKGRRMARYLTRLHLIAARLGASTRDLVCHDRYLRQYPSLKLGHPNSDWRQVRVADDDMNVYVIDRSAS